MTTALGGVSRPLSPTFHVTGLLMVLMFLAIFFGSFIAKVEVVARGQGKVVPSARVQEIQPLTDGRVIEIPVRQGQTVKAGDVLLEMDPTAAESLIQQIVTNLDRQYLSATIAKSILTPLTNRDPADAAFLKNGTEMFERLSSTGRSQSENDSALFGSVLTELQDKVLHLDAQIERVTSDQIAQRARIQKTVADMEMVADIVSAISGLHRSGSISELDYRSRVRELKSLEGDTVVFERQFEGMAAEVSVLSKQRSALISSMRSNYAKQLSEAHLTIRELNAELKAAKRSRENLTIRAPVDGRVDKLSIFTKGAFVNAGAPLMFVVPSGKEIEIEAFFDNRDVGFMRTGQRAFIKFDTFPAERFGMVYGQLTDVSADARNETGKWVYAVRVDLDNHEIRMANQNLKFLPGMTATIDIITGERRLISYFFEPVLKSMHESFGER